MDVFSLDFESFLSGASPIETLIVLNAPPLPKSLEVLWRSAKRTVCADGGANVLFESFGNSLLPEAIVGDLDSVSSSLMTEWEALNVEVIRFDDQDSTDLDKCLNWSCTDPCGTIAVVGMGGSRLDHLFGIFNSCYTYAKKHPLQKIVLLGADSVSLLLPPGVSELKFPGFMKDAHCGLIPLFGEVLCVRTKGLRWELNDDVTSFGNLFSTSNRLAGTQLEIQSTGWLVWTIEKNST